MDPGGKTGREARCLLLLSGFLQRARQSRGAALWPLAVAHRWREVAQCADKSEESDSGESESGRELGEEGWRWRGGRQLPAGGNLPQVEPLLLNPRCIYTAQVNEASPDLFRPAINTPLCVVLFTQSGEFW